MKEKKIVIQLEHGMHARPAALFVREAGRFASEILLSAGGITVNGKSIMGILMLALGPGTEVDLRVDGTDEVEAIETLSKVLNANVQ